MRNANKGSALPAVLGLLLLITAIVSALAFFTRTERNVMRQMRSKAAAEVLNEGILASIMSHDLPMFLMQIGNGENLNLGKNGGNPSNFKNWQRVLPDSAGYLQSQIFSSILEGRPCGTDLKFLQNDATNYLPAALSAQIDQCRADWIPVESVDEDSGKVTATNALYAYAVADISGFLDASCLTSNQLEWLERNTEDIRPGALTLFLEDMARHSVPSDGGITNYISRKDMILRNRGIGAAPANIMHFSYSPAPDVTITNGNIYSDLDSMNRNADTVPKFAINSIFEGHGSERDPETFDTEAEMGTEHFRNWFREVTNRLDYIGFAASEEIAWSLVNFMDPDRIPQSPRPAPWQDSWPVEDVPLINEIAVAQVPLESGYTNAYAAAVEVWFPFSPNPVTEDDDAWLVTAVYTNWPPSPGMLNSASWTNDVIFLDTRPEYGMTFSNRIERMEFGTSTEFLTFASPPPYITFPVDVYSPAGDANVLTDADGVKYVTGRGNLKARTVLLPLGVVTYSTFASSGGDIWKQTSVTVTNEIRMISRVMLGGHWVDEAMAYNPHDKDRDTPPYAFRETCGFEVNDPRRNNERSEWKRYLSTAVTGISGLTNIAPDAVSDPDAPPTFGTTNSVCDAWHLYGQGLPIVHFNGPLKRSGDIGYIHEPYSRFTDEDEEGRLRTNRWQSICLADYRALAYHGHYTFSAGSLLEFFTVRCATNSPVRGLVNAFTPWPGVTGAIFADAEAGHGLDMFRLGDEGIRWACDFYRQIISTYEESVQIPIGPGDICMYAGDSPKYRNPEIAPGDDVHRWNNSIGSETKEDVLRHLAEKISFRQQLYIIVVSVKSTSRSLSTLARQTTLYTVIRDSYTGAWSILSSIDIGR